MSSIKDDKGYNQGFELVTSTRIRMMRRASFFSKAMEPGKDKQALEIGCGTGEISYWIARDAGISVLGTDICVPFIDQAAEQYKLDNLRYEVLDFNNPGQIMGRKFDYVFGNGILHHLYYNLDNSLLAIKALLKPGGKLIFMEPNIYNPYCQLIFKIPALRKWANLEPDEMAFSNVFIRKKLEQAGYTDIRVTFRDFLLPGIPAFLVKPSIFIGNIAERVPLVRVMAQSIFIEATIH